MFATFSIMSLMTTVWSFICVCCYLTLLADEEYSNPGGVVIRWLLGMFLISLYPAIKRMAILAVYYPLQFLAVCFALIVGFGAFAFSMGYASGAF
jgi:hypothetical protein